MGNFINEDEETIIEDLFEDGVRVNQIARLLKRSPSSISRVLSGERGAFWRSHKTKKWRCSGCGGTIREKECRVCRVRSLVKRQKETRNIPRWDNIIKAKEKEVLESKERFRCGDERRNKLKTRIDPETGVGKF